MKRLRKRMLSILLVLAMAFSLMPSTALAVAEVDGWDEMNTHQLEEVTVTEYRKTFDIDGYKQDRYMLVISPVQKSDGELPDYEANSERPWDKNAELVSAIYIEDGVTEIGNHNFADMPLLETVTVEDSSDLTRIGDSAFANDRYLTISEKDDGERVLSLPNVTEIGEQAFLNCTSMGSNEASLVLGSQLVSVGKQAFYDTNISNITFTDLAEGTTLTIGENAFAHNDIESITLPEGLTEIGNSAFAYNRFTGSLVIPDSVTSIGDNAFFVSSDNKNQTLTELTLGKSLEHVGQSAFRNYMKLATVNVLTTNTTLMLDNYAFGHDQSDAYWTDKVIDGQNYYVGADFKIVGEGLSEDEQNTILDAFDNGVNCYLGSISPLRLVKTEEPTCLTNGTHTYKYSLTVGTGNVIEKDLYEIIPHLDHKWVQGNPDTIDPSCEQPGGSLFMCENAKGLITDNKDVTVKDTEGQTVTVLANGYHYQFTPSEEEADKATGHHYQPSSATSPTIDGTTGSGATTLTYACDKDGHVNATDEDFNSYGGVVTPDQRPERASFTINWKKINVNTLTTLDEIEEQLSGMVANNAGALSIVMSEGQDGDSTLAANEQTLTLLFTPSNTYLNNFTGMTASSQFGDETLQLKVQVNKVDLDFTNVYFQNASVTVSNSGSYIYTTIAPGTPLPEGAGEPKFTYLVDETWKETPPSREEEGTYKVKATVEYNHDLYQVTKTTHTSKDYTIDATTPGMVTITTNYEVKMASLTGIVVSAPDAVYDGSEKTRVHLSNVPQMSTVVYSVTDEEGENVIPETTVTATGDNWEEIVDGGVDLAKIKDAGKYTVSITVSNDHYDGTYNTTVDFTIEKKPVAIPEGLTLTYNPTTDNQQGVPSSTDGSYTLGEDCFAVNAGDYEGTVTLTDPDNTCWEGKDSQPVQVTYTINPLQVTVPTMTSGFVRDSYYDGTEKMAVQHPTAAEFNYEYQNGALVGTYHGHDVFTVSNAQQKDAGVYSSVASLKNPAQGKPNYIWFNTQNSNDQTIVESWIIRPASFTLPTITVGENNSVEYTGNPLDLNLIKFDTNTGKDDYSLSLVSSDTLTVGSYTWLQNGKEISDPPTDVGTYQLKVTFNLSEGAKLSNYTFTGDDNSEDNEITKTISVVITKTSLTLQDSITTATFTGGPIAVPTPTILNGLLGGDTADDVALTYSYTPESAEGEEAVTQTQNIPFTFTNVGTYTVSVQPAADSNYMADPVNVTLTISKATQKVKLIPDKNTTLGENNLVTKELNASAFSVTGSGYIDNSSEENYETHAQVTYSIQNPEGRTVAEVENNGTVTIKGAGTATITVKAAADDNGNYGAAEETYTLTVNKATPTIDVSKYTESKFETGYTGNPIEGYDKATLTGAGNGAEKPIGDLVYTFYTDEKCQNKVNNGQTGEGVNSNIPIAVGTYYLKITYGGDSNYNPAEEKVITVSVTEAEVGNVTVENYEAVYNGKDNSLSDSVTGVNGFNTGDYTVKYIKTTDGSTPTAEDEGWDNDITVKDVSDSTSTTTKYWYKVTIDDGNYAPKIGEIQVAITPAELTVNNVPDSFTKVYDSTDGVTEKLNGITVTGVGEDEIVVSNPTGKYETEDAGSKLNVTINLTLSGITEWGNYKYNGSALTEGNLAVTKTGAGTINQKEITVTGISAVNRVYDGTARVTLAGEPKTEDMITDDDLTLTLAEKATGTVQSSTAEANDAANVGNGKKVDVSSNVITLSGDDASNYKVVGVGTDAGGDITVNITKRPVTLEFVGIDGEQRVITKPYTGQPVDVVVAAVEDQDGNAGFVGNDNLKADDVAYTYTPVEPTTDKNHTAVGDYTVTAELMDSPTGNYGNYDLRFPTQAILRITNTTGVKVEAEDYTGAYTGQAHDVTDGWGFTGYVESTAKTVYFIKKDDTHTTAPEASSSEWQTITFKDVSQSGEYWWKVSADSHEDVVGTDTVKITITPLDLEINTSLSGNGTKEYDGDATVDETITGTVSGTVKGETITATAETASYDKADAGDRTITISYTLSGADLSNYTYGGNAIPDNGQIEVTEEGKITPKEITVTILNKEKVYDGEAPVAGSTQTTDWTVEEGAIVNNDNLGVTLTVEESEAAVDTYHITGKVNNSNYDVTFAGEDSQNNYGVYTVTARPISVQIGDASGIYGDAPDMSCGENKIELTDTTDDGNGIVADENIYTVLTGLTLTTTADNTSDVGSNYTISAKSGNNQYGNYQVTFTNGTYTVKQRPVTITIADKSSAYGCELERLTSSDAYTGDANKDGIVNEDNLGIQLTTTASASANVGSYPISGKADNEVVAANYAITWVGENGGWSESDQSTADSTKATYTITKASLTIAFTNESVNVSMGGTIDNPLGFTNTSSEEELSVKPEDVQVKYESSNTDVATVNETTGEVTIVGTGDATITATVTNGGQNFEADSTDSYVIHVAGASTGIQVQAVPNTGLTYNGAMQELLNDYTVSPQTAEVTFEVEAQTEGDQCEINEDGMPTAQDAGTYRVSWTAKQSGYADVTGWVDVTIAKAAPSTGFSNKTVQTEYAEHKLYDSTQDTWLNQAEDYAGNITYLSNNTQVAKVTENNLKKIQIFGTGDATISAQFAETDNFNAQTVSFTLTVTVAGTKIDYTVSDYEVTYNGQPHGADITVNNPSTYTIMYSNNQGTSYELTDSPVITDVKDGPLTIYFQIQADGYASVTGTQTVTVTPKEITEDMVSGIAESYTYTGKQITPESELVMDGNTRLTKGTDYTVSYGTNITVGPGSDETLTDGGGWVKITGTGNYSGAVTKYFAITAVDSGSLTAALDRYYGFYNDEETNHATVQVHHNISGQTGHDVDTREITVTVAEGPENGAKINGTTVTFTQVGTYKLAVEVTGTHSGSFTLLYALLPATSGDGLILTVDGEDTPAVSTYGEKVNGNISVTSDGTALNADAYTLTYSYQPFAGDGAVSAGTPYDAAEVFGDDIPAAGLYVITATAKEGSGYTGTGTFVFLVQQKHLEDSMITEIAAETYTGSAQQPEPKVSYSPNGEELLSAADYTVSHHDNVNAGEALAIVTANKDSNNFTGSARKAFTINPKPITDETVTIAEIEDQYYTGNPVVPDLTITDGGYTLVLNHDYEVTCADQGPGQATVTITGIGNYTNQTEKTFTIIAESEPQPTDQFTLTVEPDAEWTYGSAPEDLEIQVKFGDTGLTLGEDYTLTVNGVTYDGTEDMSLNDAVASLKALKPGQYKVTAQGIGDAFSKSSDTAGIQVFKVKPTVTVTATPGTLSGSGEVTLTLTGSNLPAGTDLTRLLTATRNGTTLDLSSLNWTQQGNVWTAKLALPNADATYIFTLAFAETDTHAAASDTATVVTAKHTNSGGTVDPDPEPEPEPEPDPAPTDPDDTGVSDWLDTDNHKVYLNGYPDDSFQPEKDMTRAEAAQMFYNLLRDQDVETTVSFTDVAADAWYATAVNALASLEIVNGVGDDRFSPERTITRAEFTTMAMRFCDEIPDGENIFSDVDQEDWFYEYVVGSIQYGWINGYPDGTFRPNDTISRAEVTTITNRMLGRAADEAFVDQHQDSLRIFTDLKDTHWAYYQIVEATNAHEYTKDNGTEDWTKLV